MKAAEREIFEETNLVTRADRIAYVEDSFDEGRYVCKYWVCCELEGGDLSLINKAAGATLLKDAGFFSKEEIQTMNVFPSILKDAFWEDLADGFSQIKYLGISN